MPIEQKIDELGFAIKQEKTKSQGIIGNFIIYFPRTFNWLQRKMWKICFGLEITNLKE